MKVKDFFSLSRYKAVIIFILKKILRRLGETETYLKFHEIEQYHFRMLRCPDCVIKTKCVGCGCHTEGRMNNKTDYCSKGKWGMFFDKEQWDDYKQRFNVKFTLEGDFNN